LQLFAITNRSIFPIQMVFMLNSLGIALWIPRIPDVKAALDLNLLLLSLCFFAMPAGTLIGFTLAPRIIARLGQRLACLYAGAGFLLVFILPALAWNGWSLGTMLFLSGLSVATIEVAMNAKASQIQEESGQRIMSRCHGFWSIGSTIGGLAGGAFAQAGISFATQQFLVEPLLAAATVWAALNLPPDATGVRTAGPAFSLPSAAILALCVMPLGCMLAEGAMMEWSALFARDILLASPWMAAVTFAAFAMAMAFGRLTGDWVTHTFGLERTLMVSAALSAVGLVVFASATALAVAIPAAVLVGLGIANVYPIAMTLAGRVPGAAAEKTVAAVAFVAFSAFLVGPPIIGTIGHNFGLPLALGLIAPVGLLPVVMILTGRLKLA
jgi:MFS family permease